MTSQKKKEVEKLLNIDLDDYCVTDDEYDWLWQWFGMRKNRIPRDVQKKWAECFTTLLDNTSFHPFFSKEDALIWVAQHDSCVIRISSSCTGSISITCKKDKSKKLVHIRLFITKDGLLSWDVKNDQCKIKVKYINYLIERIKMFS